MKIRRRIVLDDVVDKKNGFLDYKQDNFMSEKSHFSKGVDPQFLLENLIFSLFVPPANTKTNSV